MATLDVIELFAGIGAHTSRALMMHYHGWRDARKEQPEDQQEVLVCTRSKNGVRNIDKGYWSIDRYIHRGSAEVTHWMPLPDFPEDSR